MVLFICTVDDRGNLMDYTVTGLAVQYHSEQAMVAARKMSCVKHKKHKRQTGQMVCHHLKMMLQRELADGRTLLTCAMASDTDRQVVELSHDVMQIQLNF